MPIISSLSTMDYSKGFRKKAFQTITLPAPTVNTPIHIADVGGTSVNWKDIVVDLGTFSITATSSVGGNTGSAVMQQQQHTFSSGEVYSILLLHEPLCGSTSYYTADLQVDRVSTNNTATSFKTFGDTTNGFNPHNGSTYWYQRYRGTFAYNVSLTNDMFVSNTAANFRGANGSNYDIVVGTTSSTIKGDVGGTGSSSTGISTNRAGSSTGYYVYSESSGSSTQFSCKRFFLHQLPGPLTLGGSANQKFGMSLGMYGAAMGMVRIYVSRIS